MKMKWLLQLFAEGGEGAGEGGSETSQVADGNGQETEGTESGQSSDEVDRSKTWKEMIKGEYKDEYHKSVQSVIDNRFKQTRELEERLTNQQGVLDFLSNRYGIEDASDVESMLRALEEDDSMFEERAAARGMSVEQYREFHKLEQENEAFKRAEEESQRVHQAEQTYAKWMEEAQELREVYPAFNFEQESQNQDFLQLLQNGVGVRTAYEVVHHDDIIQGAMQMAASKTAERMSDGIRAKGVRPQENGVERSSKGTETKIDVNKLTVKEMEELEARARRGEKIVL